VGTWHGYYTWPGFMYGGWTGLPSKNLATKQNGNPDQFFFFGGQNLKFTLIGP